MGDSGEIKVFWFFSSEKNILLFFYVASACISQLCQAAAGPSPKASDRERR
jgi:hypothetical protein